MTLARGQGQMAGLWRLKLKSWMAKGELYYERSLCSKMNALRLPSRCCLVKVVFDLCMGLVQLRHTLRSYRRSYNRTFKVKPARDIEEEWNGMGQAKSEFVQATALVVANFKSKAVAELQAVVEMYLSCWHLHHRHHTKPVTSKAIAQGGFETSGLTTGPVYVYVYVHVHLSRP